MHDPAGDPTYEPQQPFGDPTPMPGQDPPPETPQAASMYEEAEATGPLG
jgi:hypothetical protein